MFRLFIGVFVLGVVFVIVTNDCVEGELADEYQWRLIIFIFDDMDLKIWFCNLISYGVRICGKYIFRVFIILLLF